MVSCGCFSGGSSAAKRPKTSEYAHQSSFPQLPTSYQQEDNQDIYARLSEVIPPIDAERSTATVNLKAKRSTDFDDLGLTGSRHALLAQPSGGFTRTRSMKAGSLDLRRSISDKGEHLRTPATPNGSVWTESRKELELAIQAEKAKDHSDWNPDLQSEEQRLRKRLSKLSLEMKVMAGDGNCQFRAVSHGLYGSQDFHQSVRQKAVEFMRAHKDSYDDFLGENINDYLDSMEQPGTWGDELTLRAISDYWGIVINVVTSDQHNWFMRYKPPKIRILLEIFLTYIAPVHYNAIRRQTVTGALRSTLSRQTSSSIDLAMKRAYSAERALASTKLAPGVREALQTGHKLDVATTAADAPADPATTPAAPLYKDFFQRRKTAEKGTMDSVAEGLDEGRVSVQSTAPSGSANSSTLREAVQPTPADDHVAAGPPPQQNGHASQHPGAVSESPQDVPHNLVSPFSASSELSKGSTDFSGRSGTLVDVGSTG